MCISEIMMKLLRKNLSKTDVNDTQEMQSRDVEHINARVKIDIDRCNPTMRSKLASKLKTKSQKHGSEQSDGFYSKMVKFTMYSPSVFQDFRYGQGISEESYINVRFSCYISPFLKSTITAKELMTFLFLFSVIST